MIVNALSVDVEDSVHAHALGIPPAEWECWPLRVVDNTRRILDLLAARGTRATFFVLAWVAERHPELVRAILAAGHELASHGSLHARADRQEPRALLADLRRSKQVLEDIGGVAVFGYRAPSFSIGAGNWWAYDLLAEAGYAYSSSIHPIRHDSYGMPDAPRAPFAPRPGIVEVPVGTLRLGGVNWPCGGGGFFRLLPYAATRAAIRRVNRREGRPFVFYIHPWDLDPGQTLPPGLTPKARLRHTLGLGRAEARLRRLAADFTWDRMDRVFSLEAKPCADWPAFSTPRAGTLSTPESWRG